MDLHSFNRNRATQMNKQRKNYYSPKQLDFRKFEKKINESDCDDCKLFPCKKISKTIAIKLAKNKCEDKPKPEVQTVTKEEVCDCTHTQACKICAESKDIDWSIIENANQLK